MPRNTALVDSVLVNLFRTAEWRSIHRFIMAESAEDTPDIDGLITQVMSKVKGRMVEDYKNAQAVRVKEGYESRG